ncbi:hypothetical protein PUN28_011413 [Cardiocondyla obscurior]|uniref:Uncharacterized protein n=1 Tax=Cardiocondyla obscurior TaxID=286306 RepID=A0AAW2FF09_9HYME
MYKTFPRSRRIVLFGTMRGDMSSPLALDTCRLYCKKPRNFFRSPRLEATYNSNTFNIHVVVSILFSTVEFDKTARLRSQSVRVMEIDSHKPIFASTTYAVLQYNAPFRRQTRSSLVESACTSPNSRVTRAHAVNR